MYVCTLSYDTFHPVFLPVKRKEGRKAPDATTLCAATLLFFSVGPPLFQRGWLGERETKFYCKGAAKEKYTCADQQI